MISLCYFEKFKFESRFPFFFFFLLTLYNYSLLSREPILVLIFRWVMVHGYIQTRKWFLQ